MRFVLGLIAAQAVITAGKQTSFLARNRGSSQEAGCPGCKPATGESGDGDMKGFNFYPEAPVSEEVYKHFEQAVKGAPCNFPELPISMHLDPMFPSKLLASTDKQMMDRAEGTVQRLIATEKYKKELLAMVEMPHMADRYAALNNITKLIHDIKANQTKLGEKAGKTAQKEKDDFEKAQDLAKKLELGANASKIKKTGAVDYYAGLVPRDYAERHWDEVLAKAGDGSADLGGGLGGDHAGGGADSHEHAWSAGVAGSSSDEGYHAVEAEGNISSDEEIPITPAQALKQNLAQPLCPDGSTPPCSGSLAEANTVVTPETVVPDNLKRML